MATERIGHLEADNARLRSALAAIAPTDSSDDKDDMR
jgi:hypothetical protein